MTRASSSGSSSSATASGERTAMQGCGHALAKRRRERLSVQPGREEPGRQRVAGAGDVAERLERRRRQHRSAAGVEGDRRLAPRASRRRATGRRGAAAPAIAADHPAGACVSARASASFMNRQVERGQGVLKRITLAGEMRDARKRLAGRACMRRRCAVTVSAGRLASVTSASARAMASRTARCCRRRGENRR